MLSAEVSTKQIAKSGKVKRVHRFVHHWLLILQTVYFFLRKITPLLQSDDAPFGFGFVTFYYGKP